MFWYFYSVNKSQNTVNDGHVHNKIEIIGSISS